MLVHISESEESSLEREREREREGETSNDRAARGIYNEL